jgi:hypothetical protein
MEVMGWPKDKLNEHLKNVLKLLKEKLKWKMKGEEYAEPEQLGEKMYITHVEFEGEAPSIHEVITFSMLYGPSVVEILDPPELYITAGEMQDILADVISKVHLMDKEIKMLAAQNKKMTDVFTTLEQRGIIKKSASDDKKDEK